MQKKLIIGLASVTIIILGLLYLQAYTINKLGYQFDPRIIPTAISSNAIAYGDLGGVIALAALIGGVHMVNSEKIPILQKAVGVGALIPAASAVDMMAQAFPTNLCMVGVGLIFAVVSLTFLTYVIKVRVPAILGIIKKI